MNRAFGQRLGEILTSPSSLGEQQEHPQQLIPVEEIVCKEKLAYVERLSELRKETEKSLLISAMSQVHEISQIGKEISNILMENRAVPRRMIDSFQIQCLLGSSKHGFSDSSKAIATSLIQDMVEQMSLSELYRNRIAQIQFRLSDKEDAIRELQQDLERKCMKQQLPEIALQLAAVTESKSEKSGKLISIVSDLLAHNINEKKRWNDDTKSLFAIILDYGGPALLKIIKEKIGGPSLQTTYATARSKVPICTKLAEGPFAMAASFYGRIGYRGPFALAIDATAILPCLRIRGNRIIGVASEEDIFVHTAQDIIDVTRDENREKARLANAFVLTPLQKHVPSFTLAISPAVKGQDCVTVRNWFMSALNWGAQHNLQILGIGADGDSKFRKYFLDVFLKRPGMLDEVISVSHKGFNFVSIVKNVHGLKVPTLTFPDWKHLIKKWRNQILNVRRVLVLGDSFVMIEDLMRLFESKKLKSGLWKSDIFVRDKQNVDAALRILQPKVRECLCEWDKDRTHAIRVYLKAGHNMMRAYKEENLSVKERAKLAWSTVCFVRLWKSWIEMSSYPIESSFISLQTYNDMVIAGHSLILSMKLYSKYFLDQPFHPSTFGSDSCERLFARCRGFCKGKTSFCMLEMLDICGRIAKLDELKLKNAPVESTESWPELVEEEILRGINEAEKEVLKTIERLGMLPLLAASNILRVDDSGEILYINPGMEENLADVRYEPDESETITVDELLDFDSDILCSSAEANEQCYSYALSDLAASTVQTDVRPGGELNEDDDDDDDDDDPRHCHFFQMGTCKYTNSSFKAPKTTHWIGCDYPGCENWFHESCLSLKFSTDLERETYVFVCKSHGRIKDLEQFKDRVSALVSDPSMIEEEEQNEGPSDAKRQRRSNYNGEMDTMEQSAPPNYVEYEGDFYHIAEFLSLQQGKVYNPSTSRMARWMSVSRNNFYERVEKLVAPNKTENGLYIEDIASFWIPRLGMRCGLVLRLVRSTSTKSAVPVFEWKKENNVREKVSVCFQVLSYTKKENNKWLLSQTNEILWSECKTHLLTFGKVEGVRQWPLEVDAEVLENLLPQLEKEEEESRRDEEKLKAIEKERRKMGPPEDMTVYLLKEVLDGLNITYRSNEKKAELIAKVRQARANLQDKASRCDQRTTSAYSGKKKRREFKDSLTFKKCVICLFYYDDRKERLLQILFQLLFLLEVIGAYLEVVLFQQIIIFIVMANFILSRQSCVMAYLLQLLRVWMVLLSSWLFAQVRLQSFLGGAVAIC